MSPVRGVQRLHGMRAIDQLREEHARAALVGQFVTEALEPFRPLAVARGLDFFINYVGEYLHAKEEVVLVPELLRRSYDVMHGPALSMRKDHALFQAYLYRAREAFLDASKGDQQSLERLRRFTILLVDLELKLGQREEKSLFMLAESLVPPSMDDVLLRRFAEAVEEKISEDDIALYERFADNPTDGTVVTRPTPAPGTMLDPETLAVPDAIDEQHDTAPARRRGRILFDQGEHRCLLLNDFGRGFLLQANQYLIQDGEEGMVLDPGGPKVYPAVYAETMATLADGKLRYVFLSHQDPDIVTSLNAWLMDTEAEVYTSQLWMRFLPHFGLDKLLGQRLKPIPDEGMTLRLGKRELWIMPAHFLHSCGNFQIYDPVSKILFSGDLGASFGSNDWVVHRFEDHEPSMRRFHQRYMASNAALREWVRKVRQLDITTIAPQHGAFIRGREMVRQFVDWCENLECGVDTHLGRVDPPKAFRR